MIFDKCGCAEYRRSPKCAFLSQKQTPAPLVTTSTLETPDTEVKTLQTLANQGITLTTLAFAICELFHVFKIEASYMSFSKHVL